MTNQHNPEKPTIIDVKLKIMLMSVRQGLIMIVTAIEKYVGVREPKFPDSETK